MKKYCLITAICILIMTPVISQSSNEDTTISVQVQRDCDSSVDNFRFTGVLKEDGVPIVGTGGSGYFTYFPYNLGSMSYVRENLSIYKYNRSSDTLGEKMNLSEQPADFYEKYLFNNTDFSANASFSRLLGENGTNMKAPYWYDKPFNNWNESKPKPIEKQKEFIASENFTSGYYMAHMDLKFQCEFKPRSGSPVKNVSSGNTTTFSKFDPSSYSKENIEENILIESLNVSIAEKNEDYVRSVNLTDHSEEVFRVYTVEGNGSTPDDIADVNKTLGRELDTNADTVENLSKNSSLDSSANTSRNANINVDANQTSQLKKNSSINQTANKSENASISTDTRQKQDASRVAGDSPQPGQTEVPEPEPEPEPRPDPRPRYRLEIRPLETTYNSTRGSFSEIGLEVTNIGESTISNIELSPRFSDGMNWDSQPVSIDSISPNQSLNRTVYVRPGQNVDPGVYQIPVFASLPERDISSSYVDVKVKKNVTLKNVSKLSIAEAPQDIRFEVNKSYTLPVLLENTGNKSMENVQVKLQNAENCGDYSAEDIEKIAAGETASVSINFSTAEALRECKATIIASSDSGSFAFSELTVKTVEEKGIVPPKFRVPIIASLWTVMLIIYTVVFKRYGLDSITVKAPLVILIAGEAFILIYLSSAYYGILPPGFLPFSSA